MEFKSIKIKKETHKMIKIYCIQNEITIYDFIDNLVKEKIKYKKNNEKMDQ